ncbi:MAG: apolipoprotein N-acyltransferase [Phycisphaeraceae bacterium]|nr:apolipoprotein N-acyltransferase [Phycisphaeraceae bacterium]
MPSLITAVLLGLSYPPVGWGWLAHVALVPQVVLALRADCNRRLAWVTYVVATAWWLVMLRWLLPVTAGGWAALSMFMALYTPVALVALQWLRREWRIPATIALPMIVASVELVRGYGPAGGFAWFGLGHSQAPFESGSHASRLIQVADLFGEHAVSCLVAMTNGLVADLLTTPWMRRRRDPAESTLGRIHPRLAGIVLLWAAALVSAHAYGAWRIRQDPTTPALTIAVIQTNQAQSNKDSDSLEQLEHDWNHLLQLTRDAVGADETPVDLVVWPETVVPGPLNFDAVNALKLSPEPDFQWFGRFHDEIADHAKSLRTHLLTGAQAVAFHEPQRQWNSVFLYDPDGQQQMKRYDKMHLVPYGEFVPWVGSWPWAKDLFIKWLTPYDFDYTVVPGTHPTIFEIPRNPDRDPESDTRKPAPPTRIVTPICFEDAVPRVLRRMVYDDEGRKRADALVNLTNDGWFRPDQRLQHLQIAVFRSVENRVPTARSVNTGVSGFISSTGRVAAALPVDGDGFNVYEIRADARRTLFGRLGHRPMAVMAVATAVLTAAAAFRRRSRQSRSAAESSP